jgi:hypothetical protein
LRAGRTHRPFAGYEAVEALGEVPEFRNENGHLLTPIAHVEAEIWLARVLLEELRFRHERMKEVCSNLWKHASALTMDATPLPTIMDVSKNNGTWMI